MAIELTAKCFDASGHCIYSQEFVRKSETEFNIWYAIKMMRLNPAVAKIELTFTWPPEQ